MLPAPIALLVRSISAPFAAVLAGFAALACARPPAAPYGAGAEPRLLIVGWDGASFRMVDPLLAAGKLPNLARLIERGSRARIESTIIPISSAAWLAAATGKGSGETGVFCFFEPLPQSYELALVSSRSNRATPLWRLLTARGVPSIVFGVPLTFPPEPILGTLVTGMLTPTSADCAWPPGLSERLRARGFDPDLEPWLDEYSLSWNDLLRQLLLRENILRELLGDEDWRLSWIVFKEIDILAHTSFGSDLAQRLEPVYVRLDEILGTLLELVGEDTNVIVMSDHGFTGYARGLNLHELLIQEGFAVRKSGLAPEPLPEGPLAKRLPAESIQRLDELDLASTRAYAYACEGNYGSLRLNLRGREPLGTVAPEEVEGVLASLEERLRAHPWVVRTFRAEELLPGKARAALPDLLFETVPDVQVFAERGAAISGEYGYPLPDHDLHGIFVSAGPSFGRAASEPPVRLIDIAPTALHLLGQPVLREMHGEVLTRFLDLERGVEFLSEAELPGLLPPDPGRGAYSPAEIEELEKHLSALGYGR